MANKAVKVTKLSISMCFVILVMLCLLNSGRFIPQNGMVFDVSEFYKNGVSLSGGGVIGMSIDMFLIKYIGRVGLSALLSQLY